MYISISIDLAGSTDAKRRILSIEPHHTELRHQHYEMLAKTLLGVEDRFYGNLFRPESHSAPPLNPNKFFVVKNIGDEIWMLYELPADKPGYLIAEGARILEAAFDVVNLAHELVATSELDDPHFNPKAPPPQTVEIIPAEIKVYLDLISDFTDVSAVREKFLLPRIGAYGVAHESAPSLYKLVDPRIADLVQRLNIGYVVNNTFLRRGDIIGFEVDRFFRTSKAAEAGIVAVGDTLFPHLALQGNLAINDVYTGAAMIPLNPENPAGSRRRGYTTFWKSVVIPAKKLKGIGADYKVWYLADDLVVRNLHDKQKRAAVRKARSIFPKVLVHPKKTRGKPKGTARTGR